MRKIVLAVVVYLAMIVGSVLPDYRDPGPPPRWRHMNARRKPSKSSSEFPVDSPTGCSRNQTKEKT